jgi:hypothetical protein
MLANWNRIKPCGILFLIGPKCRFVPAVIKAILLGVAPDPCCNTLARIAPNSCATVGGLTGARG